MDVIIDSVKYVPAPDTPTDTSLLAALEIRFDSDAGDDLTIRDYLHALLETLWKEGEGFSGKRPFGNSGWEYDLYGPLVKAKFIHGRLGSEGDILEIDEDVAKVYVANLITAAFYGVGS